MTKMMVIGDRNTVLGMKLGGMKNCIVADASDIEKKLFEIPDNVDIIVITPELRREASSIIRKLKDKMIIELPDGGEGDDDLISKMIRDVIGFEMK